MAKFNGQFPSAGAELRIAIAGPLVSLALGVVFVLMAVLGGLPEAVDGVAAWLGYTNLPLLVFNLLPALPLDGGRVLRAPSFRQTLLCSSPEQQVKEVLAELKERGRYWQSQ